YMADTETSGKTYNTTSPIDGTEDDLLYQSERWGNFSYSIPVANGSYSVTLKLAELYESNAGRRIFSVKMEGKEVITNLDLFATVGKNKAYDVTIPVAVSDGVLNVEFSSPKGDAKVNAISVTSSQAPKQFVITATGGAGGTVNPSGAVNVTQGGQKNFAMTPNAGYYIAEVKVDGVSKGAVSTYTFTNVTAAHTIVAAFGALSSNQYALTINQAGTGSGTAASNPSGVVFPAGTAVTLSATPSEGSVFAGWSGACSGASATCVVTMNGSKDVTATFNLAEDGGTSYKTGQKGVVVDLDGDGKNDVVWFNEGSSHVYAWYLNGARFKNIQFIRNVS
ncbi:MAG: hypothetical protein FJY85_26140, partial [Deltaproteobacteria bacterium]|nr:hypothetical protein [Deltaproteobacteria bacterium]